MNVDISIIIPCYNEEQAIPIFYESLNKVTKELKDLNLEYIFIDDGSKDKTLEILEELCSQDKRCSFLSFSRNFGKEAAMYAGLVNSTGDLVVVIDVDGQHPPELIPEMVKLIKEEDYDTVTAITKNRKNESLFRSFLVSTFYKVMNRFSEVRLVNGAKDYRMMKREIVDIIVEMEEQNRFTKGIYEWLGYNNYWLTYEPRNRVAGSTKWKIWDLFKYSFDGLLNFSRIPFFILILLGIILILLSLFMITYSIILQIIKASTLQYWKMILSVILFIGGIQIISLGIIGAYISKIYLEVKKRPHFIISKTNRLDVIKVK